MNHSAVSPLAEERRDPWLPMISWRLAFGLLMVHAVTPLFNVLVTAVPKSYAGDVGALRGVTQNLAAAVGTALIGAMVVGFLAGAVLREVDAAPEVRTLVAEAAVVDLDRINFISNDNLTQRFAATDASPEVVAEAVRINTGTRLRALQIGFFVLSLTALVAIIPCRWLPDYRPTQIPEEDELTKAAEQS